MSKIEVHDWLGLDLAARQRKIREYYATFSPDSLHDFLGLVRAPHGYGVYASIGPNYQYAVFGRDSIMVAHDLVRGQQSLAKEIILMLASLQGQEFNMQSEEEQGKIHHEYRSVHFGGHDVPKAARIVLQKLGPLWGGSEQGMLYYGAYDSTPLFISLVAAYCRLYGEDILDQSVPCRNSTHRPLRVHVREATSWLVGKITASPWDLYEFKRLNPVGLVYQAWEDSSVSYLHSNGTTANADDGIAAVELQGYAYDALHAAAQLVAVDEYEANAWRHLASIVRENMLARLWMGKSKYFAIGLDRSDRGSARQVEVITANPGLLLSSEVFDRLPHQTAWPYIEGIVRMLFSEELLTTAGLRLRSLKQTHLISYPDYHGNLVTWPYHTAAIAVGLRKQGFYRLAALLEDCVLQSVAQAGEFYEFFFVDQTGKVKYHYRNENPHEPSFHELGAINLPEPGQAWTISAVLRIVASRQNPEPVQPVREEIRDLEADILARENVADIAHKLRHAFRT